MRVIYASQVSGLSNLFHKLTRYDADLLLELIYNKMNGNFFTDMSDIFSLDEWDEYYNRWTGHLLLKVIINGNVKIYELDINNDNLRFNDSFIEIILAAIEAFGVKMKVSLKEIKNNEKDIFFIHYDDDCGSEYLCVK